MFNSYDTKTFYENIGYFLAVMVGVFVLTFGVLYFFNLVPHVFQSGDTSAIIEDDDDTDQPSTPAFISSTLPDRISIAKIGLDTSIVRPASPDITTLNNALSRGAVYYPGSGTIEQGNIFVFGHSADIYRNVQNPSLKVFNNFTKLIVGDEIVVTGDGKKYVYKVTSVRKVIEDDAVVTFDTTKRKLTLSTCNTFGEKQDRIVVEADFSHIL